jgi:hypothetical protein
MTRIAVDLPEEIAKRLEIAWRDVPRGALEAVGLEGYRDGTLTRDYGDNLDVLRRYVPDESVDLVYLDPPFNSNANLRGTVEREKAAIGVLITMDKPTAEMRKEAATGEFYISQWGSHAKIQILTVADLLAGKTVNRPPDRQTGATFKKAPKDQRQRRN